jgi:urea transporter
MLMNSFQTLLSISTCAATPWTGLLVFIAVVITDRWQVIALTVGVLTSTLLAYFLGLSEFAIDTGLVQINACLVSQVVAYHHVGSPPFDTTCNISEMSYGVVMIVISSSIPTFISHTLNSFIVPITEIPVFSLPVAISVLLTMNWGFNSKVFSTVGRCRLTVSKPKLKARLVSALETKLW